MAEKMIPGPLSNIFKSNSSIKIIEIPNFATCSGSRKPGRCKFGSSRLGPSDRDQSSHQGHLLSTSHLLCSVCSRWYPARSGHAQKQKLPVQSTTGYTKPLPTFSDAFSRVKQTLFPHSRFRTLLFTMTSTIQPILVPITASLALSMPFCELPLDKVQRSKSCASAGVTKVFSEMYTGKSPFIFDGSCGL